MYADAPPSSSRLRWADAHDTAIVDAFVAVGPSIRAIVARCAQAAPGYPWPAHVLWAIEAFDAAVAAAEDRAVTIAALTAVADRLRDAIEIADQAIDDLARARAAVDEAGGDVDRVLSIVRGAA